MTTPPRNLRQLPSPAKRSVWKRFTRWVNTRTKPNGAIETILVGLLILAAIAGIVALFAAFVMLGGLIFYLAWNLGVVGVVGAAGGTVSTIDFWTAVGASLFLGIIKGVLSAFGRGVVTTTTK